MFRSSKKVSLTKNLSNLTLTFVEMPNKGLSMISKIIKNQIVIAASLVFVSCTTNKSQEKSNQSEQAAETERSQQSVAKRTTNEATSAQSQNPSETLRAEYDAERGLLKLEAHFANSSKSDELETLFQYNGEPIDNKLDVVNCPSGACFELTQRIDPEDLKIQNTLTKRVSGQERAEKFVIPEPVDLHTSITTWITSRPESIKLTWKPLTPRAGEKFNLIVAHIQKTKTISVDEESAKRGTFILTPSQLSEFKDGFLTFRVERSYVDEVLGSPMTISSSSVTRQVYLK